MDRGDEDSHSEQDKRVETLWRSLHTGPVAPLDLEGLREGLRKIDHRQWSNHTYNHIQTHPSFSFSKCRATTKRCLKNGGHQWRWAD